MVDSRLNPGGSAQMNSKGVLAGLAILLFTTPFSPRSVQRDNDPNVMITFHGGSASHILPFCDAAVKVGVGTREIKTTATEIEEGMDAAFCRGYVLGIVDSLTN